MMHAALFSLEKWAVKSPVYRELDPWATLFLSILCSRVFYLSNGSPL